MNPSVPIEVLPFDGEPLTSPRALAATLGYTQRMVRYWTDEGCPFYNVDGLRRFRESEVRQWLRAQGRLSKSPEAERPAGELNVHALPQNRTALKPGLEDPGPDTPGRAS